MVVWATKEASKATVCSRLGPELYYFVLRLQYRMSMVCVLRLEPRADPQRHERVVRPPRRPTYLGTRNLCGDLCGVDGPFIHALGTMAELPDVNLDRTCLLLWGGGRERGALEIDRVCWVENQGKSGMTRYPVPLVLSSFIIHYAVVREPSLVVGRLAAQQPAAAAFWRVFNIYDTMR